MPYTIFLSAHSYLRWIVLILALVAVFKALSGWLGNRRWEASDQKIGGFFVGALDLQFLVGIILFAFLSPITEAAFQDFGAAMANKVTRFFVTEHTLLMLVSVAMAHVGRSRSRRIEDPVKRHKTVAIFFGLSLILMLAGIPWSFLSYGRPLFR